MVRVDEIENLMWRCGDVEMWNVDGREVGGWKRGRWVNRNRWIGISG